MNMNAPLPQDAEDDVTTEPVADASNSDSTKPADVLLHELNDLAVDFNELVAKVQRMHDDGFFKYASKPMRNDLMLSLLDKAAQLEMKSRYTYKSLKKVKRVRVPEEVVDSLLVARSTPTALLPR